MTTLAQNESGELRLLRHALATLAYRAGKALRGTPEGFAEFRAGHSVRTPDEILSHLGDLFDWALSLAQGRQKWQSSPVAPSWEKGVSRFFASLQALDDYLASGQPIACSLEKLFQAPMADALTHVGQIAMLRRLADAPVRGENFLIADIEVGRVGREQAPARFEFD
jgi:hypothetical protein